MHAHHGGRPWVAIPCWSHINSSLLEKYLSVCFGSIKPQQPTERWRWTWHCCHYVVSDSKCLPSFRHQERWFEGACYVLLMIWQQFWCERGFLYHQAILPHQLGGLQFRLTLTISGESNRSPRIRVPARRHPLTHLETPLASPSCLLCF